MTKSQKEIIVAGILIVLLIYMAWTSFLKQNGSVQTRPPDTVAADEARVDFFESRPEKENIGQIRALQAERTLLEWGDDPFSARGSATGEKAVRPAARTDSGVAGITLKGTAGMCGRMAALINSSVVYEGDVINNFEIVSITESAVILKREGREYEIRIDK